MTSPASVEDKIDRYLRFWRRTPVDRPLIGFSVGGWFPLQRYRAMQKLRGKRALAPDDLHAEEFLDDYQGVVALWDGVEDNMIRGVAPIPPFPWLEAMLGCRVQIGAESIWAEEGGFEYAELARVDFTDENPWRRKYLEFVVVLKGHFGDRVPVGQPILRGPSDMIAAMRGSSEMIFDFYDHPDDFGGLAERCTDLAIGLVRSQQAITGPFAGGYLIEQLGIWAPTQTGWPACRRIRPLSFLPICTPPFCSRGTGGLPRRFRTPRSTYTPRPCSSWMASSTSNRSAASRSTGTSATRSSRR